ALHLPEFVETPNRLTISRVEALCILLRRLAYPSRLVDVGRVFGRHPADISTVTNVMLNTIMISLMTGSPGLSILVGLCSTEQ
ncbi:hypothetical protein ElyMa_002400900, partial [Elysia marginata]